MGVLDFLKESPQKSTHESYQNGDVYYYYNCFLDLETHTAQFGGGITDKGYLPHTERLLMIKGKGGEIKYSAVGTPKINKIQSTLREREATIIALKNLALAHKKMDIFFTKETKQGGYYSGTPRSLSREWVPESTDERLITYLLDGKCSECGTPYEQFEIYLSRNFSYFPEKTYTLPGFVLSESEGNCPLNYNTVALWCPKGNLNGINALNRHNHAKIPFESLGITQEMISRERCDVLQTLPQLLERSTYTILTRSGY
jgi:hypothetical protein